MSNFDEVSSVTLMTSAITNSSDVISQQQQLVTPRQLAMNFRYFGIVVGIFSIVVGTLGNLLTIIAYHRTKKLQTGFHMFILNLSIVDMITASCMLPFNVAGYINGEWPFENKLTARLQAFSYFSCGYSSVSFLVAITINRFIGVMIPHQYSNIFRDRNMKIIIATCWLVAPLFLLPFLIGYDRGCGSISDGVMTGFSSNQLVCTFICLVTYRPYMEFTRVLFQLLPFPLMIVVYTLIFLKRINSFNRIQKISGKGKKPAPAATQMSARQKAENEAEKRRQKANMRLLKVSMVICATFAITFLPSVFINLVQDKKNPFDVRYHMLCSNLSWFNATLNPVIYAICNPNFREAYKRIILNLIGRGETTRN